MNAKYYNPDNIYYTDDIGHTVFVDVSLTAYKHITRRTWILHPLEIPGLDIGLYFLSGRIMISGKVIEDGRTLYLYVELVGKEWQTSLYRDR